MVQMSPLVRGSIGLALLATLMCASPAHATDVPAMTPVRSDDDFATQVLGDAWDMSGSEDIAFERTRDSGNIADLRFEDGLLLGRSITNDPRLSLQIATLPGINAVPKEGGYQPINADVYRYLTIRLFVPGAASGDFVQVFWQQNGRATTFGATPPSSGRLLNDGWNTLTIDLKTAATTVPWENRIEGLFIDPTIRQGVEFKIDFVRLSANPPAIIITMPGSSGELFISRSGKNERERITKTFDNSYEWKVGLAAGSYEVAAGGASAEVLVDTTPQLVITAPSYTSGPEFATEVRGKAWDMDRASDIDRLLGVSTSIFANGILTATSNTNDPQIWLHNNTQKPIDTNRYKYLTYRMRLGGNLDIATGSVGRVLWTSTTMREATTSLDWVIYEGWRTVSFDLTKLRLLEGGATWSQSKTVTLRLDPHEFEQPRQFEIDYVRLTGDDRADKRFDIRYKASDTEGAALTVQFFYTSTQGVTTGGTPIVCLGSSRSPLPGGRRVFVPLLSTSGSSTPIPSADATCSWDTSAIPAATYYIYGTVSDGRNSRTLASHTGIIVEH